MINELYHDKEKYFWSKSEDKTIIVGGTNNRRFYGKIELVLNDIKAIVKITISNGVSSSMILTDRPYSHLTPEYSQIKELYDTIDDYLNDPDVKLDQEVHRERLLQNVFDLLPKYSDSE